MLKFGRNYMLTVQVNAVQTVTIQLPFTMQFDITRNVLSSANVCQIRIYNLGQKTRNLLRFNMMDQQTFVDVKLKAGYGNVASNLPILFDGNITRGWSQREGVNFITYLQCFDGGFAFANGQTNMTFPASTTNESIIASLIGSMPHTTVGAVGSFPGSLSRGNAYAGNTADLLRQNFNNAFFIDNGVGHCINNDEYIVDSPIVQVNADSGLLGTPLREQNVLHFDILFAPEIKPGRLVNLASLTDPSFNGLKKVTAVSHRGVISGAVAGEAVSLVTTWYEKSFSGVVP